MIDGVIQCVCKRIEPRAELERENYLMGLRGALWDAVETLNCGAAEMLCECLRRLNEQRWDEGARFATWDEFRMLATTLERVQHLEAVCAVTHGPETIRRILGMLE